MAGSSHNTRDKNLKLSILPNLLSVCQLNSDSSIPAWAQESSFFSVTKTSDELSIVCDQSVIPPEVKRVDNWRAFKVLGPLDFSQIGIIDRISACLAENKISIFVISSFDTDYVLVKKKNFEAARIVLADNFSLEE